MEDSNPELETFRKQWQEEVTRRSNVAQAHPSSTQAAGPSSVPQRAPRTKHVHENTKPGDEDIVEPQTLHFDGPSGAVGAVEEDEFYPYGKKNVKSEPQSALEHYEKAVEREGQGSLGDSLDLYRKAFRLDDQVDRKYKNKHFPPSAFPPKPTNPNPSNASATVPNTAHHSPDGPPQTIKQLIESFSDLSIEPSPPEIEGTPAPPCPIADVPDEILIQIFKEVAIRDVADLARITQVCKRMAYLVATGEQIWKRICLGSEFGFEAMHYQWQTEVTGELLEIEPQLCLPSEDSSEESIASMPLSNDTITHSLLQSTYSSSWKQMFRLRPRIRFNGCYISTVNYIRPGQASPSAVAWNSPVHIVTYYRYLRFYRDGTLISLLTTTEPSEVVHHLTKELLEYHRRNQSSHLPSSVMSDARHGRWRLSSINDSPSPDVDTEPSSKVEGSEGTLFVETEGVHEKYFYRMELKMTSAGKTVKNNKLAWNGFWNYNRLTDDWGEFTLRNDKAFFWSRVKSYGMGA
ncbi:Bchrt3 [Botrytis cinerea B05.10]|uniref:Bchrt3 n=3 Tax=Botryotinia fuckeliana TaxID=40559 RepID=A0A384JIP9_BOTFB|nr:Bchrt3 [Botrytis cinerea B05.10]ATZ50277.1 Bchrt3 [Botrytis cinerea B05.10]EMR80515.1 putative f-box protein pof7 protein [Botrytis cinerea BcDW1]